MDPIERLEDEADEARALAREHRKEAVHMLAATIELAKCALVCLIENNDTEAQEDAAEAAQRAKDAAGFLTEMLAELNNASEAEQEAGYKEYRSNLDSYHAKVL